MDGENKMSGDDKPDKYTNEWYRVQLAGITHNLNRLAHEYVTQHEIILSLRCRIDELERHRAEDMAEIGAVKSRLDAAAAVVAKMKKEPKG